MKNYGSSFVFTVLLAAGLHQVELAAGLPPLQAKVALQKLRGVNSYGWTTTTAMQGPPVTIAPMSGKTVKFGGTVIDWTLNGQRLQAAQRSGFTAIKTNTGWQTSAEIATSADAEPIAELLTAMPPADELARLLPLMTVFTIKATMSLLLMQKDITRTQTVELSGYDALSVTLPAEAVAKHTGQWWCYRSERLILRC